MLVFGGEDKDVTEQLQTRQKSKCAKDFTETCLKEGEDSLVMWGRKDARQCVF